METTPQLEEDIFWSIHHHYDIHQLKTMFISHCFIPSQLKRAPLQVYMLQACEERQIQNMTHCTYQEKVSTLYSPERSFDQPTTGKAVSEVPVIGFRAHGAHHSHLRPLRLMYTTWNKKMTSCCNEYCNLTDPQQILWISWKYIPINITPPLPVQSYMHTGALHYMYVIYTCSTGSLP